MSICFWKFLFILTEASIFHESEKNTLKNETFTPKTLISSQSEETPIIIQKNRNSFKKTFTEDYLDQLEKKVEKIASKRTRSHQNNVEFEDLLLKFSPYKKTEKTHKNDQTQDLLPENIEKLKCVVNEDLKEFLMFLGRVNV